ncbi:MAG: ATP-binding protein [Actinomycetales bacterium]|jgi:sensor histidine kinase regulating citrate/malate metabolism
MARANRRWSIASRIFALQLIAVLLLAGSLTLFLWLSDQQSANDNATKVSLAVATTLANDPFVIAQVQTPDPTTELQPLAVREMRSTGVDFVTIMDPTGTRFTHPNPAEIGKKFIGTIDQALKGKSLTETYTGTLGPSVRAVVPVMKGGRVIAIVAAGVTTRSVASSIAPRIPFVLGAALLLVILGSIGAYLARRFLSRVTGEMLPSELSRMVSYYQSVLHSVREGLILADEHGQVVLYNDEAAELLDLPPASSAQRPMPVAELDLPMTIADLIRDGGRAVEETHVAGHRLLVVNQEPATPAGGTSRQAVGTLMTLRDRTEVQRLAGELESVRTLSDALRSQTHEYANRLHTVVSLLELGRQAEAIDLIAQQVERSQSLADDVLAAANEPAVAALLLGKVAQAEERGVELSVSIADGLPPSGLSTVDLVSVVGNLVDNAIDAAAVGPTPAWVQVTLVSDDRLGMLVLTVADSGRGVDPGFEDAVFSRGFSTKPTDTAGHGFGLPLVRELLESQGGNVELRQLGTTEFVARWPVAPGAPR